MGVALGWVALALAGVAASPHPGRQAEQITYTVRYVEAEGVGWREPVFARLKPVTRQGAATVWTVPTDARTRLLDHVTKNKGAVIVQSPKVTAFEGAAATIHARSNRKLVTQVAWNGVDQAVAPAAEDLRTGWHTTMVGRKIDQGILVQIVLEDTQIRAIHHLSLVDSKEQSAAAIPPKMPSSGSPAVMTGVGKAAGMYAYAYEWKPKKSEADKVKCDDNPECPQAAEHTRAVAENHGVSVDVPEIGSQEVAGEWLIPSGECLLVSFGAYTVADPDGKAVVKERLAIVEAQQTPAPEIVPRATQAALIPPPAPIAVVPAPVAPPVPLPIPTAPSRSYPEGFHADGKPADLPALPEDDEMEEPASESAEPLPSPQSKKPTTAKPKPASDAGTSKAEFVAPKIAPFNLSNMFLPGVGNGLQFLLPIKPFAIKLPFNQKLQIEILGRVVPDTETTQ